MLVNGVFQETIAISDRGFQYGDGVFETIEIYGNRAVFLKRHLARLNNSCTRLLLPPPENSVLMAEINQLLQIKQINQAVLKIIITRGSGGRGYRQPDIIQPTRVVSLHPFPDYLPSYYQNGITARFCETRLGSNSQLAGIKHLNRLEQILARAEWHDNAIQEGIMLDNHNQVIEGTMSNLFYVKNNVLYTAPIENCGIAGIMRSVIIELAQQHSVPLIENYFSVEQLLNADEAFVCNSILGIWRIKHLENKTYLARTLTDFLQKELVNAKK